MKNTTIQKLMIFKTTETSPKTSRWDRNTSNSRLMMTIVIRRDCLSAIYFLLVSILT